MRWKSRKKNKILMHHVVDEGESFSTRRVEDASISVGRGRGASWSRRLGLSLGVFCQCVDIMRALLLLL